MLLLFDDGITRRSAKLSRAAKPPLENFSRKCYHFGMRSILDAEEDARLSGRKCRLLLHACCGPCCAGALPQLADAFEVTLFFHNPNILPKEEFIKRLDALKLLLTHFEGVGLIVPEQSEDEFLSAVRGMEELPEGGDRCTVCFALRLSATAAYAAAHRDEFDAFATTLTVGPRKNAALINTVGEAAGRKYSVPYLASDFKKRDGYLTSVRLSKEYGIYRQHYCGCGLPGTR